MDEFFFHRPWWFLALLPLGLIIWRLKKRHSQHSNWGLHIDAHLLPHILTANNVGSKKNILPILGFSWLLMVFVLTGPSWKKTPPVVLQADVAPLFILLDLSRSMLTRDIYPDRLTVAKAKIRQLLNRISPRPISLIVYSAMAHQVMPLTEDRRLIGNLLEYLRPELMPAHGSNSLVALQRARELIEKLAIKQADLLLISDGIDNYSFTEAEKIVQLNGRIHIYAIATEKGAYIPEAGRGYLHIGGQPVHTNLRREPMQKLAEVGQGHYQEVIDSAEDINNILHELGQSQHGNFNGREEHEHSRVWQDQAAWLLLLLVPLAWLLFQPGLYAFLFVPLLLGLQSYSPTVLADWQQFWKNDNQLALQAMQNQRYKKAEQLFQTGLWRGIAQYRQKKFQLALASFSRVATAEGFYNHGNTLVQLGRYQEALSSFRTAIEKNPQFKPARHNLELIQKALKDAEKGDSELTQPGKKKTKPKKANEKQQAIETVEVTEVAEDLLDSPTERDLQEKKDRRDLNLENIGSQGGAAMLAHDVDKDKGKQGGSIGQGMGEGSQELQQQDQLARKGQGNSTSKQEHAAQRIVENKFALQKATQASQAGEQGMESTATENIQEPSLSEVTEEDKPLKDHDTAKEQQQKKSAKGGSGANTLTADTIEQQRFLNNWLKSIEDNPSDLLKEIFKRDYESRLKNRQLSESQLAREQELEPW